MVFLTQLFLINRFASIQCATFKPEDAKSVAIKGLKSGQRCTFRIKAVNQLGESEPLESRAVTVQKAGDAPKLDEATLAKLGNEIRLKSGKDCKINVSQ